MISLFREDSPFVLSWSHYLVLMRIKDDKERSFYEVEAAKGGWNVRTLRDKNDAMVELTLPKDSNIYASKYELYLPDKKLLQKKLEQWLEEES